MGLRINQNIAALNSYRNLSVTDGQMSKSLEKLSSGFRINRAADDAAGLAISEGLRSQIGGLKVAVRNAQDGISVVQTAEGALTETHSILQRMRDLSVQSNNGTQDADAQAALQAEFDALNDELARIKDNTKFNGSTLLDGTAATFQVGDDHRRHVIDIVARDRARGLHRRRRARQRSTSPTATRCRPRSPRSPPSAPTLGAIQNRFEHTINNLNVAVENLSASESRIRDTDMAQEMVQLHPDQILSQAGTAMLAQANQAPQGVLSLLR